MGRRCTGISAVTGRRGCPGNVYRPQLEIAQRLFAGLSLQQQKQARAASAPIQTQIELQRAEGSFQGIAVATLAPDQRMEVRKLLDQGVIRTVDISVIERSADQRGKIGQRCLERGAARHLLRVRDLHVLGAPAHVPDARDQLCRRRARYLVNSNQESPVQTPSARPAKRSVLALKWAAAMLFDRLNRRP